MSNIYNYDENEEQVREIIAQNPAYLMVVTLTEERCLFAIKTNPEAIKYIPQNKITFEMGLLAIQKNQEFLKLLPKELLTEEFYLTAITQNQDLFTIVPKKFRNKEYYKLWVKSNGAFLANVPEEIIDKDICFEAVSSNGMALRFVPKKYVDTELCNAALSQNLNSIRFVPKNKLTKKDCCDAVKYNIENIKFVRSEYLTEGICDLTINNDWKYFIYTPEHYKTLDRCIQLFKSLSKKSLTDNDVYCLIQIAETLPNSINNNIEIIKLYRKIGVIKFKEKGYNAQIKRFVTIERILYNKIEIRKSFKKFDKFYKYLYGDLEGADLLNYDFKRIKLKKYNISGALINCDVLLKHGLYDENFYNSNTLLATESEEYDNIPACIVHDEIYLGDRELKFYYISDIHLNHQIKKHFPQRASKEQIVLFVKNKAKEMANSIESNVHCDYLLIAGDVSFSFDVGEIFYTELCKHWESNKIFVVLGNHELWDYDINGKSSSINSNINNTIAKYRNLFEKLGINFLYNEMLVHSQGKWTRINIENINSEDLISIKKHCHIAILGGLGYTGYCEDFNAECGLYRHAIKTLEDDIINTKAFEKLYNAVLTDFSNKNVIVLTHTPLNNWSKQDHNPNWVYVNGHTHKNDYEHSNQKVVYADNQIGYRNLSLSLKHFKINGTYDIFDDYPDGIYEISREEYLDFYRGKSKFMQFKKRAGKITMLKKSGYYCFLFGETKHQILNGGIITKGYYTVEEAYDKMSLYVEAVNFIFNKYHLYLQDISSMVKKFGGNGRIHGAIIDIDYFCHLYVNPSNGKVFPYYATSIVDKFFYNDIEQLLDAHNPQLYTKYKNAITSGIIETGLILYNDNYLEEALYIVDTDMYSDSRKLLNVQYLLDDKIIKGFNAKYIEAYQEEKEKNKIDIKNSKYLPPQ